MQRLVKSVCVLVLVAGTVSMQATEGLQTGGPSRHRDLANAAAIKPSLKTSPVLWPPSNVDDAVPPVAPDVSCPIDEVLLAAQQRVLELARNLARFTATESVDSSEIGKDGRAKQSLKYSYNYLAEISQTRSGHFMIDESRKATGRINPIPIPVHTMGLALGAIVFHPLHLSGFKIVCEGLGQWHGKPAWQLHFEQRPEKFPAFQEINVHRTKYDVKLKGRAWIDTEGLQIEHIDFDLLEHISPIRLVTEHMEVDYRAVDFPSRDLQLWLPQNVALYIDVGGHRYLNRHRLTNYLLFAVEIYQELQPPRN